MDIPTESLTNDERRRCVRIGLPGESREIVLSDGISTVRATFADQSAEGFGVRCGHSIPWPIGQTLMLNDGGHWHEVQVMRLQQLEGEQHVGMRRVRERDDYHGPSVFQQVLEVLRGVCRFRFTSSLQIFGICSGFLLCIVVLVIVLRPTEPMKQGGHWVSSLFADITSDEPAPASELPASPGTAVPVPDTSEPSVSETDASETVAKVRRAADERVKTMLSGKMVITWSDVEDVMGLTEEQSEQLLSLLNGGTAGKVSIGQIDTTKIVIESRKDFAAFVKTLPEKALAFLTDQQLQYLQSMLELINQP